MTEKKILIVDRDKAFRSHCASLLEKNNYRVEVGSSFCEAVKLLMDSHFDCLIMDVDLPEIKGYEVVSIVKNLRPKVKVILTTKRNSRYLESKVREQDVFYYFIKSFGEEELVLAINNAFKEERRKQS